MKFELCQEDVGTWSWIVTSKNEGTVAQAPTYYHTEADARTAISKARKAFGGYKFAKVEVIDARES